MKSVAPGASDVIVISATLFKSVLLTGVMIYSGLIVLFSGILGGYLRMYSAIFYTFKRVVGKRLTIKRAGCIIGSL
jgi:hypothetical protein